jgi:hypothetical protein
MQALQALQAGTPLLVTSPAELDCEQIVELCETAARSRALLRFAGSFEQPRTLEALRRSVSGREALVPAGCIATLRLARAAGSDSLRRNLREELATIACFCDELPLTARASLNTNGWETASGAFLNLRYANGVKVRSTVSLTQDIDSREVLLLTRERPIRLHTATAGGQRLHTDAGQASDLSEEFVAFCHAVQTGSLSFGNAGQWSGIAGLWAAVEESVVLGGTAVALRADSGRTKPPSLRLIEGGGRNSGRGARPRLTLVAG